MTSDFQAVTPLLACPRAQQIFLSMLDEPFSLAGAAHAAALHPEAPIDRLVRFERAVRSYEDAFDPVSVAFPEDFLSLNVETAGRAVGNAQLAEHCLHSEGLEKDTILLNSLCCKEIRELTPPPPKTSDERD